MDIFCFDFSNKDAISILTEDTAKTLVHTYSKNWFNCNVFFKSLEEHGNK